MPAAAGRRPRAQVARRRFWGKIANKRVRWLGYDSGIKPGVKACTVAGCTAQHDAGAHQVDVPLERRSATTRRSKKTPTASSSEQPIMLGMPVAARSACDGRSVLGRVHQPAAGRPEQRDPARVQAGPAGWRESGQHGGPLAERHGQPHQGPGAVLRRGPCRASSQLPELARSCDRVRRSQPSTIRATAPGVGGQTPARRACSRPSRWAPTSASWATPLTAKRRRSRASGRRRGPGHADAVAG